MVHSFVIPVLGSKVTRVRFLLECSGTNNKTLPCGNLPLFLLRVKTIQRLHKHKPLVTLYKSYEPFYTL